MVYDFKLKFCVFLRKQLKREFHLEERNHETYLYFNKSNIVMGQ